MMTLRVVLLDGFDSLYLSVSLPILSQRRAGGWSIKKCLFDCHEQNFCIVQTYNIKRAIEMRITYHIP